MPARVDANAWHATVERRARDSERLACFAPCSLGTDPRMQRLRACVFCIPQPANRQDGGAAEGFEPLAQVEDDDRGMRAVGMP